MKEKVDVHITRFCTFYFFSFFYKKFLPLDYSYGVAQYLLHCENQFYPQSTYQKCTFLRSKVNTLLVRILPTKPDFWSTANTLQHHMNGQADQAFHTKRLKNESETG